MITLRGLTKHYGRKRVVDELTFDVAPGRVTGFLGPNGAGKSTTMRMVLGLDRPTSGEALVDGRRYAELRHPLREVGAVLDARSVHPGRDARRHLLAMARSNGIPDARVDEVLGTVGLADVAGKRAGAFSLGMGQRLGIAGALLGDPGTLLFDEPVNGLDPDGVRWIRQLMRSLATEGRTVLVSSHLMSEMQLTADQLVVIGRGRLLADAPVTEFVADDRAVHVRLPDPGERQTLAHHLTGEGLAVEERGGGELVVTGGTVEGVGDLAHALGLRLHGLTADAVSLEQAYLRLTANEVEYAAPAAGRRAGR
ncbi:ABC-2 type transport system ATP-binding protein [Prauserella shujinwangii]|uniref:ABC-2 type transport system ATP-binding protein n=1 Tax=Prauserella shujinwangii TaxID=1453103 RepID=A0A2T0LL38_9PSEU|nr:ATP-binding cassette domain-containing protein [Prauserella shujinwangii]PRX43604.1 ABC-2 type transport system ATP-binding protein [Prauserella shujinwangii]